jgi:serine/threonine protein kinase
MMHNMQYPLISEYVKAIQDAGDNLEQLAHLTPVLDDHGEPYRSSGAFAVVFKMLDKSTGKYYALKCFTEEQQGRAEAYRQIADELDLLDSPYITSVKYMEKELFVDSQCEEDEFPVLLMDWVDGETMEAYIAANYRNQSAMSMLSYRFGKMAAWLRTQSFSHGDIKPDNIIVRPDGSLSLVDYDGMFVPSMKGCKSPTVGTKDFSHPLRTMDDFDETIDDFSLASIALSLKAISMKSTLLDIYGASDRLLFSENDYRNPSNSKVISALQELMCDKDFCTLYSLFMLALARKELSACSFGLFIGEKPNITPVMNEDLSTEKTIEELKETFVDEWGVKYSKDGRKLLKAPGKLSGAYSVKEGTRIMCDSAFYGCYSLSEIVIPSSVTSIGQHAFYGCRSLLEIVIPSSVTSIGDWAFSFCSSLKYISIPKSVIGLNGNPFAEWNGKLECLTPNYIYEDDILFNKDKSRIISFRNQNVKSYVIPSSVTSIGDSAFYRCISLSEIVIPSSVTSIGNWAFSCCDSLKYISIPKSVICLNGNPFAKWDGKLKCLSPNFVYEDGILFNKDKSRIISFRNQNIKSYVIPSSVTSIGDSAFYRCISLSEIVIPSSVASIGDWAFSWCISLSEIVIPSSVTSIGDSAFLCCASLSEIFIPSSVTSIGDWAFYGCYSLSEIFIPSSVTSIGDCAFCSCDSLSEIVIPSSVTSIGDGAFYDCKIPDNLKQELISRFGDKIFSL